MRDHHETLTQSLRAKLRDAGFSVPSEPVQKVNGRRHNNHEQAKPCKEKPMNENQDQVQHTTTRSTNPIVAPPVPQDASLTEAASAIAAALSGGSQAAQPRTINYAGVAEFGMKAAIVVAATATTTAAVVLIARGLGGSTPELPATTT